MSPSQHGTLWYLQSSSTCGCLTHKVKVGGAGFLCSAGRADTTQLPKATSGHPPVALTSRASQQRECLETELGGLGCHSDREGVREGRHPAVAGTRPPGREISFSEFQ